MCGVTHIKNPVELARAVMEHSEYVMLAGAGAEEFALSRGIALRAAKLFLHRRSAGSSSSASAAAMRAFGADHFARRHRRRGRAGWHGPVGGRHFHRRHDRQALSAHRRFAHHRRRHLRRRPFLRGVGHRAWRGVHSRRRRARHLRAHALRRPHLGRGGARGGARGTAGTAAAKAASSRSTRGGEIAMEFNSEGMFRASRQGRRRRAIAIYR